VQARIDINGILQLEVENTTEYWAINEWLKQVTLTYDVVEPSSMGVTLEIEKVKAIDPSFIEVGFDNIDRN
jgi:hypothetical protein